MPDPRTLKLIDTTTGKVLHTKDITGKTPQEISRIEDDLRAECGEGDFRIEDSGS